MSQWRLVALGTVSVASALASWLSSAKAFDSLPVAKPIVVTDAYRRTVDTLHRDEVLGTLLVRRGVPGAEVTRVLAAAPDLDPRRARAGQVFKVRYLTGDSIPERITTRLDTDRLLHISRAGDGWNGQIETIYWQVQSRRVEGVMDVSLYESIHDVIPDSVLPAGERERFIADLADGVYGWEIDFSHDIAKGDRFELLYDRLTSSLDEVRYGRLVAARIQTRGRMNGAYLMSDSSGRNAYYDDRGVSLRRADCR